MRRLRYGALCLATLGGAAGFGSSACSKAAATASAGSEVTAIDRVEWLEKTSKVLRYGVGLGPHDDVATLSTMDQSAVIDLWMQDPRFADAVLAFNLYYLGRSMDQLHATDVNNQPSYAPTVFDFPQALASAQAVVQHGDYFSLYAETPPFFPAPNASLAATLGPSSSLRESTGRDMDAAIALVATDRSGGCAGYQHAAFTATNELSLRGFAPAIRIRELWLNPTPNYPLTVDCTPGTSGSTDDLVTSMRTVRNAIDAIWKNVEASPVKAAARTLVDLPRVEVAAPGLPPIFSPLGKTFFDSIVSTSTNFNRKRAAYMLKTYFCDDLTPLSIPTTEPGDGGLSDLHASNSSCQACHYRLDPMGALFRNIGMRGKDFTGAGSIQFDDFVVFEGDAYERYLSTWRNPDGSFRAGYWVQGSDGQPRLDRGWTAENGDTITGLWSYLQKTKQVKACLVRRLAEYVLGPDQVYDREWLTEISSAFRAGPTSGEAFKGVLTSILLSKTFSVHDPEKGVCYDSATDAPAERAPCAIAGIVATNCATCHSSTGGGGHLDFTSWIDIGGGQFTWSHLDDHGQQLSHQESLRRIQSRINESNAQKRMPLMRSLSAEELATFRGWLASELGTP
jgi:hypothetical protein